MAMNGGGTAVVTPLASVALPESTSQEEISLLLPFNETKYESTAVNDADADGEGSEDGEEPSSPKKVNILRRYPKTFIALALAVVIVVLTVAVIIPQVTSAIVGRYVEDSSIEMDELEILDVFEQVANIHLKSIMHIEPVIISLAGETLPTKFDMLIADPSAGGELGVIGSLEIPRLYEEGFVVHIDVVTQMLIRSERLFNLLLSRVLSDETVTILLEGDMTISVNIPLCSGLGLWRGVVSDTSLSGTGHLKEEVSFRGLGGPYFVVDEFVLGNTTEKAATFIMRASLNNTSQFFSVVPLPVYYANLEVRYLSSYLGQMLIRTLSLAKGVSYSDVALLVVRNDDNAATVSRFFSDYLMQQGGAMDVNGTVKFDLGFEMSQRDGAPLAYTLSLPYTSDSGLVADIYTNATAVADPQFPPFRIDAQTKLANPFEFDVGVASMILDVVAVAHEDGCNETVSRITVSQKLALRASQGSCVETPFAVDQGSADCLSRAAAARRLEIAVSNGQADLVLGDFSVPVQFAQPPQLVTSDVCVAPR